MKKKAIPILVIVLALLAGCMNYDTEPEQTPAPVNTPEPTHTEAAPKQGGTLRLSMRPPKTLNPLLNEDATVDQVLKLLFEPIAALNDSQKPVSNITEINFAPDGMSVLLTVRADAKWSDGMPVVAEDIIFSLDILSNAADTVIYKDAVRNISSYSITDGVDNRSVRIHYNQPYGGSAYQLCFPIIPQHHYLGENDPSGGKNMQPVGSGLYQFSDYTNMQEMTLAINPNSYRKRPYIEKISVLITPDLESDLYALDQSQVDLVTAQVADWGKYRSTKEANITEYPTSYYDFIGFNFSNTILLDKKIRTAIVHAINVDEMLDSVYLGHAIRTMTPVNPVSWVYEPSVTSYETDPEISAKIFSDSGYRLNQDGVMEKDNDGITMQLFFRILVNEENSERVKIAGILKDSLAAVGVGSEIYSVPFGEYEEKLAARDFDIFVGGFSLSVIPDLTFAFHSSQIDNGRNYFSYQDETMDALLGQVFSSVSETVFKKSLSELQKYIAEEIPCISLAFRKSAIITDKGLFGEIRPVKNNVFANINEWHLEQ